MRQTSIGAFSTTTVASASNARTAFAGEMNNDNSLDVVTAYYDGVMLSLRSGTSFSTSIAHTQSGADLASATIDDVDADGWNDVVTISSVSGIMFALFNLPACPVGQYRPSTNPCANCNAGTFGSTTGLYVATCSGQCAEGRYGLGGDITSSCTAQCPAGRFGIAGATTSSCTGPCDPGRYGVGGSTTSACSGPCAAGRYGVGGDVTSACTAQCPAGLYGLVGSTTSAGTGQCAAGRYGLGGDVTSSCTAQCPANYYCPLGTSSATQYLCPAGSYCPAGTVSGTQFLCVAGKFSSVGSAGCTDCLRGTFAPSAGSGSCGACTSPVPLDQLLAWFAPSLFGYACTLGPWVDQLRVSLLVMQAVIVAQPALPVSTCACLGWCGL